MAHVGIDVTVGDVVNHLAGRPAALAVGVIQQVTGLKFEGCSGEFLRQPTDGLYVVEAVGGGSGVVGEVEGANGAKPLS